MRTLIFLLSLCVAQGVMAAPSLPPKVRHVPLTAQVDIVVDITPDLGTRFTFPFSFDSVVKPDLPPLQVKITNDIFKSDLALTGGQATITPGRNSFVVTAERQTGDQYLGDLFVSIGGYSITVRLRTNNDVAAHYSDIVFDITDAKREELVNDEVQRRMAAIHDQAERDKARMEDEIARRAHAEAAWLSIEDEPTKKRVKEESSTTLTNGDKITLFVDYVHQWPKSLSAVRFEVDADTQKDVKVQSVELYGKSKQGIEQLIPSSYKLSAPRIAAGKSIIGILATDINNLFDYDILRVKVTTDLGLVDATW
ncbi:MAG: hypothetical protein AABY83_15300 [Pseudomonadota bacterium]